MFWIISLIPAALIAFWLGWRHKHRKLLEGALKFPGPRCLPFLGNALTFATRNPEEQITVLKNIIAEYGDAVRFWLGPDLNIIISNPADIKVLLTSHKTSAKGPQYKYMADMIGGGILSGSGPKWRRHRKLAAPFFAMGSVESYCDIFNREIDLLLEAYSGAPPGQMVDVYRYNVRATTHCVCQGIMGLTKNETKDLPFLQDVIDRSPKAYDIIFNRMTRWYLQIDPVFWLTDLYKEQEYIFKRVKLFSAAIIDSRRKHLEENAVKDSDIKVLDKFIMSKVMSDDDLWQETFTIFTASQEAAAKIISFLILMLAYHPQCQEKLYAEIQGVIGDEVRWIYGDDLKRMPYLDMVFKEVIRMFPIGAMIQRTVLEDITISTHTLPAGSSLTIPIYQLQRDPRYWENPNAFDPERFHPEVVKTRDPNCFIPFSVGPMNCLGRYFGTQLVKMMAARAVQQFSFTSEEEYKDLKLYMAISVKSVNGYRVIINSRK